MTARQILVVDDEVGIRELLSDILQDEGYHVRLAENAAEARDWRKKMRPDLVLLDIWMPDCDGITLLKEWSTGGLLSMPVVMMSGHGTIDTAVEATRIGAFDFLEKPIALQKLLKTVGAALKFGEKLPKTSLSLQHLGKSPIITELRRRLEQVAQATGPVLLIGDTGSGTDLCAQLLHQADTPWQELTEFTKLASEPLDILEPLSDGVLFIREVADLQKTEQKGLLVLISRAEKQGTRVVCATSHALPELVQLGKFEAQLLQVLSTTSLRVPALNDHREDIPDLVVSMATHQTEASASAYREFDVAALNALRNASWPGNLAQLESAVQNLLQTSLGDHITQQDVERVLNQYAGFETLPPATDTQAPNLESLNLDLPFRQARDDFERLYFEYHMANTRKNMSRVAEIVQLERTHLYRKLKQLGIKIK